MTQGRRIGLGRRGGAARVTLAVSVLALGGMTALATGCKKGESKGDQAAASGASAGETAGKSAAGEDQGASAGAGDHAATGAAQTGETKAAEGLLPVGSEAPDFETVTQDGSTVKLSSLRGSPVVLYFYPKDETSGCTAEAEAFRDDYAKLTQTGAKVIGVSLDTLDSHKEFASHHKLPFQLVADQGGAIAGKYGVPVEDGYAERTTFIIGPDGKIAKVFPKVNVDGHAAEVLAALQSMKPAAK